MSYRWDMRALIYGLCDPTTGELRYVGKTVYALSKRLQQHVRYSERGTNDHKSNWIRKVGVPEAFVIESVDGDGLEEEMHHIAQLRSLGCRLLNHTAGGEGRTGDKHTPESRAKIAAAHRGRRRSAEQRKRMSDANKGRPVSEATRQKMRDALTGRKTGPAPRRLVERRIKSRQASRFFGLLVRSAQWQLSR